MNHYYALVDEQGSAQVTLPPAFRGTVVTPETGEISGLSGAVGLWNGLPPPWCVAIVEVRSPEPWYKVLEDQKAIIWRRHATEK